MALAEQQAGPALLTTILLHAFLNGPETSVFKTHSLPCTKQAVPHRHGFLCERLGPQGGTTVRWWICCQTFRDNCPSSISPSRPGSATYAMCQLKRAALMKERGRRARKSLVTLHLRVRMMSESQGTRAQGACKVELQSVDHCLDSFCKVIY